MGNWRIGRPLGSRESRINADIQVGFARDFDEIDSLKQQIVDFCTQSRPIFDERFGASAADGVLVIKYTPAERLGSILRDQMIYASGDKGYTWGDAVHVSPLDSPFSTMMYGSVGVVGKARPVTVFDGTDPIGVTLYQQWIRFQLRYYDLLTTTMHSDYVARILRNKFRTDFGIDCVFFRPDQFAPNYVRRDRDYWFALSHWTGTGAHRRVGKGPSAVVQEIEFCLVVSEEFGRRSDFLYNPWLGAELRSRNSEPIAIQPRDTSLAPAIRTRYLAIRANRSHGLPLDKVYVTHETP
jgi:hypothetical protein